MFECPSSFDIECQLCRLREQCLPAALSEDEIDALERVIQDGIKVEANQPVYQIGQKFTSICESRTTSLS